MRSPPHGVLAEIVEHRVTTVITMNGSVKRRVPRTVVAVGAVVVILAALYGARVGLLYLGADEGDVPAVSDIPAAGSGAALVDTRQDCGSGGCWLHVEYRPAPGQTPEELAAEMGLSQPNRVPGTFLDPRTVTVSATTVGDRLQVTASY